MNPEVAADNARIVHNAPNLVQALHWHFNIGVNKPEDLSVRGIRAGVHLPGPTALAPNELIAGARCKLSRAIDTFAVDHNDFGSGRPLAQMLEKRAYQWRLIINWNNDRNPHSNNSSNHSQSGKSRLGQASLLLLKVRKFAFVWNKNFYGASIKQEKAPGGWSARQTLNIQKISADETTMEEFI
jgi:hypothetical protein